MWASGPRLGACASRASSPNPVATTVIEILPSSDSSTTAPKMMLASASAASLMTPAASLTSNRVISAATVDVQENRPRAPSMEVSNSAQWMA